jgi:hypothetical protein
MRCIGTLEINARTSSVAGGDTGTKYKHLNMVTSIISFRPSCITPQLLTTMTLPLHLASSSTLTPRNSCITPHIPIYFSQLHSNKPSQLHIYSARPYFSSSNSSPVYVNQD